MPYFEEFIIQRVGKGQQSLIIESRVFSVALEKCQIDVMEVKSKES